MSVARHFMVYRLLIAGVVSLHLAFVAAAVLGGLAVLRWPRLAWIHVPVFLWAGIILLTAYNCPLTVGEKALRTSAGLAVYPGGFLEYYVHPVMRAVGLGPTIPYLGYIILALNATIYAYLIWRWKSHRSAKSPADAPSSHPPQVKTQI